MPGAVRGEPEQLPGGARDAGEDPGGERPGGLGTAALPHHRRVVDGRDPDEQRQPDAHRAVAGAVPDQPPTGAQPPLRWRPGPPQRGVDDIRRQAQRGQELVQPLRFRGRVEDRAQRRLVLAERVHRSGGDSIRSTMPTMVPRTMAPEGTGSRG
ncbi:hypothetical protein GCM10027610_063820 [Dactylosporangium cerinum]